jgi:hypothetical protein
VWVMLIRCSLLVSYALEQSEMEQKREEKREMKFIDVCRNDFCWSFFRFAFLMEHANIEWSNL